MEKVSRISWGVASDWREKRVAEFETLVSRDQRIAALEKQETELIEKLGRNSRNSHLAPSTDPPGTRKGKGVPSMRKRGGQRSAGSCRALLPPKEGDEIINLYPTESENCWEASPQIPDHAATRYQQTEMPPVTPHTNEWRCNEVGCRSAGTGRALGTTRSISLPYRSVLGRWP